MLRGAAAGQCWMGFGDRGGGFGCCSGFRRYTAQLCYAARDARDEPRVLLGMGHHEGRADPVPVVSYRRRARRDRLAERRRSTYGILLRHFTSGHGGTAPEGESLRTGSYIEFGSDAGYRHTEWVFFWVRGESQPCS